MGGMTNYRGASAGEPSYNRPTPSAQLRMAVVSATQKLLRFGVFELNLDTEELRKSGTLLRLPPLPFKLLVLLASHSGQVVTRDEIQEQLWGVETFVDFEQGVNKCIKQIRTALGDNADSPLYVETLPRHGYRFLAPVVSKTIPAPQPRVVVSDSSGRGNVPVLVGRGAGAPATVAGAVAPSYPTAVPETRAELASEAADIRGLRPRFWRTRVAWIGAAVVLLGLIGGALYWRAHKAPVLSEKDTIVLADFDNKTGDPVFDDTLKQALAIQLEQSPFLNVLSDPKVGRTLKLMNRPVTERLTEDVAREVCLRTNSKAVLTGSIASVGEHYLITLKAVNCQTGDTLAAAKVEAENRNKVLKALSQVGNQLRGQLGESLASVAKFNQPLEEATTSSLEALQALSRGRGAILKTDDFSAGLGYYNLALALDPNFAYGYASLGVAYGNLGQYDLSLQNLKRAYGLRNRVSRRERFYIEAQYYSITGELEKAVQTQNEWALNYPGDYLVPNNLSVNLRSLGQWEKAATEAERAHQLRPDAGQPYFNLMCPYLALNRLEDAKAAYDEAQARQLDGLIVRIGRYHLAFLQGDEAAMREQVAWAMGKPMAEDVMLSTQSDTEAYHGRFRKAAETSELAVELAQQAGALETAAEWQIKEGIRDAEVGNSARAKEKAADALKLSSAETIRILTAFDLARAGELAKAQKMAENLNQEFPLDTLVQKYWIPTIRAAIALRRNQPKRAVEELKVATTIELSQPLNQTAWLCPVYLRGEAYLMLHEPKAAATEFQKFLDRPGLMVNFVTGAVARLQLGRAQAMTGDKVAALKSYQDFLTLWRDADPDIPIYKQAKAEYAKLR